MKAKELLALVRQAPPESEIEVRITERNSTTDGVLESAFIGATIFGDPSLILKVDIPYEVY